MLNAIWLTDRQSYYSWEEKKSQMYTNNIDFQFIEKII